MTAEPHTEPTGAAARGADLSSAFGRPATASLRGLLPPRERHEGDGLDEGSTPPVNDAVDAGSQGRGASVGRAGRSAPAVRGAPERASPGSDRWGTARIPAREHVVLLVLVALGRGPATGREIAQRLRVDSGGGLAPPPTTVQRTVHHLARHGFVVRDEAADRPRYRLTDRGTRLARAHVREWESLRRAVDTVINAAAED